MSKSKQNRQFYPATNLGKLYGATPQQVNQALVALGLQTPLGNGVYEPTEQGAPMCVRRTGERPNKFGELPTWLTWDIAMVGQVVKEELRPATARQVAELTERVDLLLAGSDASIWRAEAEALRGQLHAERDRSARHSAACDEAEAESARLKDKLEELETQRDRAQERTRVLEAKLEQMERVKAQDDNLLESLKTRLLRTLAALLVADEYHNDGSLNEAIAFAKGEQASPQN